MSGCNRESLVDYLSNRLEIEDKLDFLFHVDSCPKCWDEVYNATKSQHPGYYKISPRKLKISEQELRKIDHLEEEVFEVA